MVVIFIAIAVVVFLALISGGNTPPNKDSSTSTQAAAQGQAGGAAAMQYGVRQADYSALLAADLASGETLDPPAYADINGDGNEEALLVAHGSGDTRPVGWYLFGIRNGGVTKLFERTGVARGEVAIQGSNIVEIEGVYAAGDPECCPSSLKRTYYSWRGNSLLISRVETVLPGAAPQS